MGLLRDTYIINKNDPSGQYAIAEAYKKYRILLAQELIRLKNDGMAGGMYE